jgi:hypothetical protein
MTMETLVNFNVRAAFVVETLDDLELFNHPNSALLAGPTGLLCCNLRRH